MKRNRSQPLHLLLSLLLMSTVSAQPPQQSPSKPKAPASERGTAEHTARERGAIEAARNRASLMHDMYAATLKMMHDRYFHTDRAIIPARVMEDVFSDMQRNSGMEARWIGVSFRPMSVDHEAETDFEKRAKKEIAAGKSYVETVEDGFYRRAGAIPFERSCISCHGGFFRKPPTKPRFAGLVISVPLPAEQRTSK